MNLVVDAMNADIATRKLDICCSACCNKLVFGLERVAVIWVGALLVLDRSFSVGMLFAFLAYKEQFALRVSGLIDKVVELKMLRLQGERLADIVLDDAGDRDAACAAVGAHAAAAARAARRDLPLLGRRAAGARRRAPDDRAGRVGGDRRAVGLRQDDAAEADAGHPRAASAARSSSVACTWRSSGLRPGAR